ncbi:hypothetical protein DPMN_050796 [Dreissena polymorpha]|uniref:Uncharacterized protein n=1 Tax=Dreissena polymorpha TaxID=45954 RepID=A0A9D4CGT8_DREPO|nr:hypothetical protein DPMN_050796 [Dreissena polymorpha]
MHNASPYEIGRLVVENNRVSPTPNKQSGDDIRFSGDFRAFPTPANSVIGDTGDFPCPDTGDLRYPVTGDFSFPDTGDFCFSDNGDFRCPDPGDRPPKKICKERII